MTQLRIERSYTMDLLNFLSVMTGSDFYTSRHVVPYEAWSQRLSEAGRHILANAVADYGSMMIGPALSLFVSSVPDFDTLSVPDLLANTELLHHHFQATPYYEAASWDSHAAPHGIKICGKRFISDVRYQAETTLRIAVHEMFHPPYIVAEVDTALQSLISTPLFQSSFTAKDPQFGYDTELGFLEENVVEAASLVVCKRQGIVADPVGYLSAREGGVYKIGVVLLAYFDRMPKQPAEPFAAFFKRVVAALPLETLEHDYQTIIGDRG